MGGYTTMMVALINIISLMLHLLLIVFSLAYLWWGIRQRRRTEELHAKLGRIGTPLPNGASNFAPLNAENLQALEQQSRQEQQVSSLQRLSLKNRENMERRMEVFAGIQNTNYDDTGDHGYGYQRQEDAI